MSLSLSDWPKGSFYTMKQGALYTKQIIITLITAGVGGALFMLLHIPVPWLLGPMIAMVIGTNVINYQFAWHWKIRNLGMVIIGYTIGLSMTTTALHEMARQLPSMLFMTVLLLLLCGGIAYVISKISDHDYSTSLLASMPGGLTQVIILAEETKGVNLAVVTVTQLIRLMLIIISMPLIVMLPFFKENTEVSSMTEPLSKAVSVNLFPNIIIFVLVGIVLTFITVKINFPTAYLIGPMLSVIILQLIGVEGPELSPILINGSQLMIGTHVGLMLKTDQLPGKIRTVGLALTSGILLLVVGVLLSFLLALLQPVSSATSLLSMAPGGMDQMGLIAHEIGADLSIVSGYQLFRTFFIFFAVPPLIRYIFTVLERKKQKKRRFIPLDERK